MEDIDIAPSEKSYSIAPGETLGGFLKRLRTSRGMSVDAVAADTRILRDYIEALEADKPDKLLPVYAVGYVRRLCGLYAVPQDCIDAVTADLRGRMSCELPEDISKSVVDQEGSEENDRRIRLLMVALCGGGALLAALLIFAVVILVSSIGSAGKSSVFNEQRIMRLQPPQTLPFIEMK